VNKAVDNIQERLTSYACGLTYTALSADTVHAAKVRIIDTLGALIGGFPGEPCRIARTLAAAMPNAGGATVIGTRLKTTPDLAAFVNATAARYVEMNDVYHSPGSKGGHPSDVVMPLLAVAEHAQANGREFITAVVLAYEIYLRFSDAVLTPGFDAANFACVGTAVAAGRLLGLTQQQQSHCIAMAVVPNNALNQGRTGHLSMWKAVAAGQAGRAGVFAALLARAGMQGPHLPFEGKAGWCDHVARKRFALDTLGGNGTPFKIGDTLIKQRSSCATTISSILAAEKVSAALSDLQDVERVTVEVYERAKTGMGTGEHHWHPDSRETADHSIPYVVAAALMDGTVTPQSFDDKHLGSATLRSLLPRIEVVANAEFTAAYERLPVEHRTRITAVTRDGKRVVGESGGDKGDLSERKSDAQIARKFRALTAEMLGAERADAILDRLWNLDTLQDVTAIPPAFVPADDSDRPGHGGA
jgi:2-methylcitrate dehydratase